MNINYDLVRIAAFTSLSLINRKLWSGVQLFCFNKPSGDSYACLSFRIPVLCQTASYLVLSHCISGFHQHSESSRTCFLLSNVTDWWPSGLHLSLHWGGASQRHIDQLDSSSDWNNLPLGESQTPLEMSTHLFSGSQKQGNAFSNQPVELLYHVKYSMLNICWLCIISLVS